MNFQHFAGQIAHTVNNDFIKPINRLINPANAPQPNFTPAPMKKFGGFNDPNLGNVPRDLWQQQLVPELQTQPANDIRLNAQKELQLTPAFTQNLVNAAPYSGKPVATAALSDQSGAVAEYFGNYMPNQIVLNNKTPDSADPAVILHEGLHRVYDTNPQVRKQFADAYNKSVTPAIKNYLTDRLYPYAGFAKGLDEGGVPIPNYDLSNIKNLPPELQNEAHSYLSELPSAGNKLPPLLAKYYSNYFNASNVRPPMEFLKSHGK